MKTHSKYLPADERRAVTVNAVIELAARSVPSEITTAEIAKHMGVTQGSLFRHFPNKEAIWEAVMGWVADRLLDRLDRAAKDIEAPLAALEAMFMSHVEFAIEHPGVPRMIFAELQHSQETPAKRMTQALLQRYAQKLLDRMTAGQEQGQISRDIDPAAAAALFVGTIQGLVMQALMSGDIRRMRTDAPAVFAIYARGLRS